MPASTIIVAGDLNRFALNDAMDDDEDRKRGAVQAAALRAQAAESGLRFEAYLPPNLTVWLLDKIERGVFLDPSEAVFVTLCEFHDIDPHSDLRDEALNRALQATMDDPRPTTPHEEAMAWLDAKLAQPRADPARWRR